LRLNVGNFNWASEGIAKKTKVIDVVYNASNNELVRTKTLVKNGIVIVDANPFKQWYLKHYNMELGK
jgi:small subunit ribosomal protein S8e